MLSTIVDDKVLDWHFKQHTHPKLRNQFRFYIGDIYVGQIHKMTMRSRVSWCAVTCGKVVEGHDLFPIYGFRTRYDAAVMLLKMGGFYPKRD